KSKVVYNNVHVVNQELEPVSDEIKVDVIIPFYSNGDETMIKCIESVKKNRSASMNKLIIVDDMGPDREFAQRVEEFCTENSEWCEYIKNKENKGFVFTCNHGMEVSENDVVLLNSDTIVTEN